MSVWVVTKGTLILALGYSALAVAIPLISGSVALAGAMVVMMLPAFGLAGVCFYLIACAANTRAPCAEKETDHPQALRA